MKVWGGGGDLEIVHLIIFNLNIWSENYGKSFYNDINTKI